MKKGYWTTSSALYGRAVFMSGLYVKVFSLLYSFSGKRLNEVWLKFGDVFEYAIDYGVVTVF